MPDIGKVTLSQLLIKLGRCANIHSFEQYQRCLSFRYILFYQLKAIGLEINEEVESAYSEFLTAGRKYSKGNLFLHLQKGIKKNDFESLEGYKQPLLLCCLYLVGDNDYQHLYQELPDKLREKIETQAREDTNKYLRICFAKKRK